MTDHLLGRLRTLVLRSGCDVRIRYRSNRRAGADRAVDLSLTHCDKFWAGRVTQPVLVTVPVHRPATPEVRTPMKVWIDQDLCTGDGLCEEIAPDVFTLLDDGLAYVKEGDKVFSDPGGAEGLAERPRRTARRRRRVRRGMPRRVHLHRSRLAPAGFTHQVSRRGTGRCRRRRRVDGLEHCSHFVVGDRVASTVLAGVDRERHPDHLAVAFDERRRPSRRARAATASTKTSPAALARAVDVGADRDDLLADTRRRGPKRSATGMAVDRAARRRPTGRRCEQRSRRRASGHASTARSRTGSNATTSASCSLPSASSTIVSSLTRDHVRVGDDEPGRGDPAAAFLDLVARAAR